MLGDGSEGGWIPSAPMPILSCRAVPGGMATLPQGWLCLSRVVQPGGSLACAWLWVQAVWCGRVLWLSLWAGGLWECAATALAKCWWPKDAGAPWGYHSGGLGGGKPRQSGEEAGGHEDMNPAVHVS